MFIADYAIFSETDTSPILAYVEGTLPPKAPFSSASCC